VLTTQKRETIFEEFIKNYLYKTKSVLKVQLIIPKVTGNEEVNDVGWEWFANAR
jgi:hypothetical protein